MKVSVIIPVYRVEKWLPACLDSVLCQTLADLEVLCVDDASPDGCPAILDSYALRDPRVRVFHLTENMQQGYARNFALEHSRGDYVYFLDSDDMIVPEALAGMVAAGEAEDLDAGFFDCTVLYESPELARRHGSFPTRRFGRYPDLATDGRTLFEAFVRQGEWTCYIQRQFWKRSFLLEHGIRFPVHTEHEDEWFSFQGILLAERARALPEQYFVRRYREDSVMTRPAGPRDFHGYFRNYCLMTNWIAQQGIRSVEVDTDIARIYEKLVRFYPLFAAQEDPEAWFSEEEKPMYRFFAATQKASLHYTALCERIVEPLRAYSHIFIYGAGAVGRRVCLGLTAPETGLAVEGFLVSRREGNPSVLLGRPVRTLEEQPPLPGSIAVVAVTAGYRQEIIDALTERGWPYITAL